MTPGQEQHLARIKAAFDSAVDAKYRAGQLEHGGDLWDQTALQLVDNAIEEALDQYTFLVTLRDKLERA
jgi:hypothetical protein